MGDTTALVPPRSRTKSTLASGLDDILGLTEATYAGAAGVFKVYRNFYAETQFDFNLSGMPSPATVVGVTCKFRVESRSNNSMITALTGTLSRTDIGETKSVAISAAGEYTLRLDADSVTVGDLGNLRLTFRGDLSQSQMNLQLMQVNYAELVVVYTTDLLYYKAGGAWNQAGLVYRKTNGAWTRISPNAAFEAGKKYIPG